MIRRMLVILPLLVTGHLVCADDDPRSRLQNMLVINEDSGHFYVYRKPDQMNVAGIHAWVDKYSGGAVTHLFICTNAMKSSFRSKTREAIWDPINGKVPDHVWPRNAKLLHDAGIDTYKVMIGRCRKKGISPWLTMRMNDVHNTEDRSNFQHSSFWLNNIDLWREPNHEHGSGLNYKYQKVRDHQMAYIRELLERYDPDGIELDWMRFPNHLSPGKERAERHILTRFMQDVRRLIDDWSRKRGHKILLGVRAPAHPDAAAGRGMDAMEWARQGLVDLIVPCPFYFSTDFDIPIEVWHEGLKRAPHRVAVVPGLESTARPWIYGTPVGNTMETLYGFAASANHRGADGAYLFNWMDLTEWPVPSSDYSRLLKHGVSQQVVTAAARRHPVCFRDTVPEGMSMNTQLPVSGHAGRTFRIHVGPKPTSGRAVVVAGLVKRDKVDTAAFGAALNGQPLKPIQDLADTRTLGGKSHRAIRFEAPAAAVRTGYNQIALKQTSGDVDQQIVWVELRLEPGR